MTKSKNVQELYINIGDIKCQIIRQRIKNTYIHIKNSNVIVTTSRNTSNEFLEKLLYEKRTWIEKKLELQRNSKRNINYQNGDIIYVLGKPYTLNIIYGDTKRNFINFAHFKSTSHRYTDSNKGQIPVIQRFQWEIVSPHIEKYYRYIALQEVPPAMEDLQERTGLHPLECNIKNLKATWGICSSKKKISINLNLMAYSRHAIEYVCLHELCHLKYMNHSKDFWNMVEYYMPDYKEAKKELRE